MAERGYDAAQTAIYNEAAADLPRFKAATLDEVRRRHRAVDFDPTAHLFAVVNEQPVGYVQFQANGRISYPWCRKGFEVHAEPLFEAALAAIKARGICRVFAAYRADWLPVRDFFLAHGFKQVREMVNFYLDFLDMPTPALRPSGSITPLLAEDIPAVLELAPEGLRVQTAAELEQHLLHNPYFPPTAVFAARQRSDNRPIAVGVLIDNAEYADPKKLDADMPCFRCGAFGTETMSVKRVQGLFSFLARPGPDLGQLGLDLLAHATSLIEDSNAECFAAQCPSDVPHLLWFYEQFFRRQGAFPVYERLL